MSLVTGLSALRNLKKIAVKHDLFVQTEKKDSEQRRSMATEKANIVRQRAEKLAELKQRFFEAMVAGDRQQTGYELEDILEALFPLFEIEYRKSYKTPTQQIDGHFRFQGFDYLVEAKWRKDQPNEQEIEGFKQKIATKLDATRGVFVSISGVRDEVLRQFQGERSSILFVDGEDITHVLEGRVDLRDMLEKKIEKAAQEEVVFFPARKIISG